MNEELVEEIRLLWCEECADGPLHSEVDRIYSEGWEKACATGAEDLCRERARKVITHVGKTYVEQFREVLEGARHELATLHGLVVCDGFEAYHKAQKAGTDAEGAWNRFVEETWQIDEGEALRVIDIALRQEEEPDAQAE